MAWAGKSVTGDRELAWKAGDAVHLAVQAWHRHINMSAADALHVAAEDVSRWLDMGLAPREKR